MALSCGLRFSYLFKCVVHRHAMLTTVVQLLLDVLLKLLDIVGSYNLKKHISFFILLLSESALLRLFDVRELFEVLKVSYVVCLLFSQFIRIYFLFLGQKLVGVVN